MGMRAGEVTEGVTGRMRQGEREEAEPLSRHCPATGIGFLFGNLVVNKKVAHLASRATVVVFMPAERYRSGQLSRLQHQVPGER